MTEGLQQRYDVRKKPEYGPDNADAEYFVLRLDMESDDPMWVSACRDAIATLADHLLQADHLTELARDLIDRYCQVQCPHCDSFAVADTMIPHLLPSGHTEVDGYLCGKCGAVWRD